MHKALVHLRRKGFAPGVVADIGAAKGYWSFGAGKIFRDAEFYMFDPLDESEPNLRALCKSRKRYRYDLCAIGDEAGQCVINLTPDFDGSTLLDYYEGNIDQVARTVPVKTLDALVESGELEQPNLIKIDVQGYEMKVLNGGLNTIANAEVVILEVNFFRFMPECPLVHEIIEKMASLGFIMFDIAGSLRRPFQEDLGQADFVFVCSSSPIVESNRWG